MYRTSYGNQRHNYSSGSLNKDSMKRSNHFGGTGTSFNASRSPLYPIGPTLTQPAFKPMNKGFIPSPYLPKSGSKWSTMI